MTLKVSTDYYAKNVVRSESVTVEAAKPQSLSASATTPGLESNVLTGTTLKVNAIVTNEGSNKYENTIVLVLFEKTWEDPSSGKIGGPLVTSKSVMPTIQPGETKNVNFEVKDLNLESEYFYSIYYMTAGMSMELEIPGIDTYFSLTEDEGDPDPDPTSVPGDADGNGKVETADIDAVVRYIMEGDFEGFNFDNANLNDDDKVDAADLVLLIKMLQP